MKSRKRIFEGEDEDAVYENTKVIDQKKKRAQEKRNINLRTVDSVLKMYETLDNVNFFNIPYMYFYNIHN